METKADHASTLVRSRCRRQWPTPKGFYISAQRLRRSAVLRRYPGSTVQQNSATLKAVALSRITFHVSRFTFHAPTFNAPTLPHSVLAQRTEFQILQIEIE